MGPARKSRSVNKRPPGSEASPSKDADSSKRSNSRKRKLTEMLGPRWTTEELTRFYDSYRKNGKDWKKVASSVRNRSLEMVEAIYTMNKAYLSLPHGTASAAGLIAMMTDHYSNLAGSDSEEDSIDGAGSSRKTQKRARGKAQPTPTASKALDEQPDSHTPSIIQNYGCLPLLKKKRSGGGRPCPVGKRTPRFPVSFSYDKSLSEKYFSPTKQGLGHKADVNEDEVHEIAVALAEASQRGGSPQISGTPSKRGESAMSSPFRHTQIKDTGSGMDNAKLLRPNTDDEDLEGSTEADTGELAMHKSYMMGSVTHSVKRMKGKYPEGKKIEVDSNNDDHLDDVKEECSGTDEGQRLGVGKANDTRFSKSPIQSQRKKSKKVLFMRDESSAFDALQTLADLSLMMPSGNEEESRMQFKEEHNDNIEESSPANNRKEKRKSSGVRTKGHLKLSSEKTSKSGKGSVFEGSSIPEENQGPDLPITKGTRRKQKMPVARIEKTESDLDMNSESPGVEVGDVGKKLASKSKKSSQSSSPNLTRISENSSSADLRKEGSDSTLSGMQVPSTNQATLPTKTRSRRKGDLKKPQVQKDLKFPETISNDQGNMSFALLHGTAFNFKEKLSNCLSNQWLRRWCTYEWFYSAIDYPWFAKREFVEYLYHVGLGHVPRLTRVEWGVIRSSLGKPRRFSEQFLKEEKEKLNQYRESVRKHYTELREGVREGLPTDLAKPLSVGQRVIAIHPKTREIHDGSVLTVDHSKCHVQFDHPDLGVEIVKDIDCMPLNPLENMPANLGRHTMAVDKVFETFNDLKLNGQAKDFVKLSLGENMENINSTPQMSQLTNSVGFLKQTKVASANAHVPTNLAPVDATTYQSIAFSQPGVLTSISKEADVQALAELTHALDKKKAIVHELRLMNDDVSQNPKVGDILLKDSEQFQKQYAAVLVQLHKANEQVSSALHCLRERNTYQRKFLDAVPRPVSSLSDSGGIVNHLDGSTFQILESGSNVNEIMDSSRTKARVMVEAAMQAISSLKTREDTIEKIEEAIDYVNDQLPSDNACVPLATDQKSDIEAQIPSELITKCVATLLMIQKCTERQFPPSDVAQILDSAVTSLHPRISQNLPVYTEIQKCVGIIKNQILALIPT
ncbi:protein ALWAYS EARLY 3-like [Andrographis paniculata]|uniref:protein ALWAYS EARLY 3-like n=1 Tax=Andrographis paniculata TaxID=175694 RepID=UPI0021E8554F|nr:protein ALWAYS EARLY 3-like [Andrographis paniculata]